MRKQLDEETRKKVCSYQKENHLNQCHIFIGSLSISQFLQNNDQIPESFSNTKKSELLAKLQSHLVQERIDLINQSQLQSN